MLRRFRTVTGLSVRLRPVTPDDDSLLQALEADRLGDALAGVLAAMGPAARQEFVDMQHRARALSYASEFGGAQHLVVTAGDAPAGRLLLSDDAGACRVVDLVLLHNRRGRGIGTAVMHAVVAGGRPVELSVAAGEPRVMAWYRRLGFEIVEENDVHVRMRREP